MKPTSGYGIAVAVIAVVLSCVGTYVWAQGGAPDEQQEAEKIRDAIDSLIGDVSEFTAEDLRGRLDEITGDMKSQSQQTIRLRQELWRARRDAMHTSADVKAILDEIAELRKSIDKVIDEMPEIAALADGVEEAKSMILLLGKARQRLMQLIAEAEKAEKAESAAKNVEVGERR